MKIVPYIAVLALLLFQSGCSGVSTVERGRFVEAASRENFCLDNPESRFLEYIRNGEIIRGMDGHEVIGSWGMPNVYLVSKDLTEEYWIYYVQSREVGSVMVYSLVFGDNILADWDVDVKRYANFSLGRVDYEKRGPVERTERKVSIEKQ